MNVLYTPTSSNAKTGNIPQQWIGKSIEESRQSCRGCPLLAGTRRQPDSENTRLRLFGLRCYAHYGQSAAGYRAMLRRYRQKPHEYTLRHALTYSLRTAKYVRFAAIGDPSAIPPSTFKRHYRMIRRAKLGVLCYTHFWRTRGAWLRPYSLASVDTVKQAYRALQQGWRRVAIHLDDASDAKRLMPDLNTMQCPQELDLVQCNNCGLCDVQHKTRIQVIVFTNR